MSFLDGIGLSYLWNDLKDRLQKIKDGKMPIAPLDGEIHGASGDAWYVLDDIAKRIVIMISENLPVTEAAGVITIGQSDFDRLDEFTVDYNGARVVFTKGSPVNVLFGVGKDRAYYKFEFNQLNRTITITDLGAFLLDGGGNSGPVAWSDIENKPDEFPPEAHEHKLSDITDFDAGGFATAGQGALAESAVQKETDPVYTNDKPLIALKEEVQAVQGQIDEIFDVIPTQASPDNQLADKNFVNSSVQNMAARYVTANAAGNTQFASFAALNSGPWFHQGQPYTPTVHDYSIFINTDNSVWRAGFDGVQWAAQYKVNDTPFTAAQLAALNSGITIALVNKLNALPDGGTLAANLGAKADKVTGAAAGNFAALNAGGNLTDSGKNGADFIPISSKGAANGVAELGSDGKIPAAQIPAGGGAALNRTIGTDANATGTVTDTGGTLSIPIPVTIPDAGRSAILPPTSTASLHEWLTGIRSNVSYLLREIGSGGGNQGGGSPGGGGTENDTSFTFVIDSDYALYDWVRNTPGNDYSRVLIKANYYRGWSYDGGRPAGGDPNTGPAAVIDLSDGRTQYAEGEPGSYIHFIMRPTANTYLALIKGNKSASLNNVNIIVSNPEPYADGSIIYGFHSCENLTNCTCSYNLPSHVSFTGFYGCGSLVNCFADSNPYSNDGYVVIGCGFDSCNNLTNCYGIFSDTGFRDCRFLLSCTAEAGGSGSRAAFAGFSGCSSLINCFNAGNAFVGNGFYGCGNLINCYGAAINSGPAYGFQSCGNLTNCYGTATSQSGYGAYGFSNCRTGFGCRSGVSGSQGFVNCYMEQSTGSTPWANTAAGGYNL